MEQATRRPKVSRRHQSETCTTDILLVCPICFFLYRTPRYHAQVTIWWVQEGRTGALLPDYNKFISSDPPSHDDWNNLFTPATCVMMEWWFGVVVVW